jgi:hypothetical protein
MAADERGAMQIPLSAVYVDDQNRAIELCTRLLGFIVEYDIAMGDHRWLTLVSPEAPDGVQLLLETDARPALAAFTAALVADSIPSTPCRRGAR